MTLVTGRMKILCYKKGYFKQFSVVRTSLKVFQLEIFCTRKHIQWNLSKADTIGAKKFVRFRQMSAL